MDDFNTYNRQSNKSMDPMLKAVIGVVVAVGVYIGNILYTKYMIHKVGQTMLQATAGFGPSWNYRGSKRVSSTCGYS